MIRLKNCKWSKADLDGKRVQFVDQPLKGHLISSVGKFSALGNETELSISVHYEDRGTSDDMKKAKLFHLTQEMADRIIRHGDPTVADFLLK